MSPRIVRQWLVRVGLVGGAALVLNGCPPDAAEITEQAVDPSQNFPIASNFLTPFGVFLINNITLADFDTTTADAFGTSTPGAGSFYGPVNFGNGWDLGGFDRNASTDPRLPLLTDADADLPDVATALEFGEPSGVCGGDCEFWNPFLTANITSLAPNDTYIVALYRYGLTVNGELDAGLAAQGLALDAADALVVAGGSGPAGDPTLEITAFPTFTAPIPADANPLILGFFPTDVDGAGAFDVVIDGTGVVYNDNSGAPSDAAFDSALVARNDNVATTFPRYNYIVLLQGPATDAADAATKASVMRWQIGTDFLSGTGAAINNGYAPFPLPFTIPSWWGRRVARADRTR